MSRQEIKDLYPHASSLSYTGTVNNHVAQLRLQCRTKDAFKQWLKEYTEASEITYRVQTTFPCTGRKAIYKAIYRCQHNTYPNSHKERSKPSIKHTDCQAKLKVTILSIPADRLYYGSDKLRLEYPTIVEVRHNHNHLIKIDGGRFKDVSDDCKEKFLNLFRRNLSPAEALQFHRQDLQIEYGNDYEKIAKDRSVCPDSQWVYRFYYAFIKNKLEVETERPQDEANLDLVNELITTLSDRLKEGMEKNPEDFTRAVSAMQTQLTSMNTESALVSALYQFGKLNVPQQQYTEISVKSEIPCEEPHKFSFIEPEFVFTKKVEPDSEDKFQQYKTLLDMEDCILLEVFSED